MTTETKKEGNPVYTLAEGRPMFDPTASEIVGPTRHGGGGLALLQDTQLIETLAHFSRERIPERVVHAKAAGAWGEFEVTHDISDITSAKFLTRVGKKTKVLSRISTVAGEKGSSDTLRDIRGWSLKFFTEEGNQDFVFNDLPVFFIRDPVKFPSMNRSHKRHPQTNVPDATMFWDFHNNNPEGVHCLMQLFGGRGVPASLRHINGYGNHTYKLGKPDGSFKYVKWHFKPDAGIKNLTAEEAQRLAGDEPDYHVKDLYDAIDKGNFPTWTLYIQVIDPKDAETYRWNIFDITKTVSHKDYPLIPVGKLTLNKNPLNYFQEIEQAAFSPSTMVPGIAPSADIMLQARMFSYPDAQRYRLGANYQQLPCNAAKSPVYSPYQRDGPGTINGNYGADPDYVRSSFKAVGRGPKDIAHEKWVSQVTTYSSDVEEDDYVQARDLWALFGRTNQQEEFIHNLCGHLKKAVPEVQAGTIEMWSRVNKDLGKKITEKLVALDHEGSAKKLQEHLKK